MGNTGSLRRQHPGRQARQPRLGPRHLRELPIQPQLLLQGTAGIAADELAGARGLFPDHVLQGIAATVGAHAFELAAVAGFALRGVTGGCRRRGQGRDRPFGRRPGEHARGRAPHRPGAEQAERVAGFGAQRRYIVQAAVRRHEGQVRDGLATSGHVDEHIMTAVSGLLEPEADAMLQSRRAGQHHFERQRFTSKPGLRWFEVQRQPAQRVVRQVHRDEAGAGEQEGQHIAEVQLVVDGGQQHHHQHRGKDEAGAGGHDVDVALGQGPGVGARVASLPPIAHALAQAHRTATALSIAITCSAAPRPAPGTGCKRCAAVCTSTAWTSSGAT